MAKRMYICVSACNLLLHPEVNELVSACPSLYRALQRGPERPYAAR
jgi:hypothetical protein